MTEAKCSFCGEGFDGYLPFKCRYCHQLFCKNHRVPESHECVAIGRGEWDDSVINGSRRHHKETSHKEPRINRHLKNNLSMPKIRLGMKTKAFLASIFLTFAAFYINHSLVYLVEFIAWCYLTYLLYRGLFYKINSVQLGNDMSFFMLRIGGGLIALVGGFFYITFMFSFSFASAMTGIAGWAFMIPIAVLSFGLLMLSAFVSFRTERRHKVLGIWRAD